MHNFSALVENREKVLLWEYFRCFFPRASNKYIFCVMLPRVWNFICFYNNFIKQSENINILFLLNFMAIKFHHIFSCMKDWTDLLVQLVINFRKHFFPSKCLFFCTSVVKLYEIWIRILLCGTESWEVSQRHQSQTTPKFISISAIRFLCRSLARHFYSTWFSKLIYVPCDFICKECCREKVFPLGTVWKCGKLKSFVKVFEPFNV